MERIKELLSQIENLPADAFADIADVQPVRNQFHALIEAYNVKNQDGKRLKKSEIESLFNVSTSKKSGESKLIIDEDRNDDRQTLNLFIAYYASRLEITPLRNRGELKKALYCLGHGTIITKGVYDNGNIEYIIRKLNDNGISHRIDAPISSAPEQPKPKPAKDSAREKMELRKKATPAGQDNPPATMPKIPEPADGMDRIDSNQNKEQTEAVELENVKIITPLGLDDILNTPEPDFLTDNLIVRGTHNVFFAPAKTGKTFLCLHYAVCMVLGIPFVGRENHLQRNIAYLNLDMDRRGFIDRVKQVVKGINPNITPDGITDILNRLRIIDRDSLRSAGACTPNFFKMEHLDDLRLFIQTNDIEFMFIDTLSRIRSGSAENSNDDMATTLQNIETFFSPLDCGSLVVHHTGKDDKLRGASAIIDNTDLVFGLKKVENSNTHLQLFTTDPRYISPFEQDVYVHIAQITNEETGASFADSYQLTTVNPDDDASNITDYLNSIGNVPTSRRAIGYKAKGTYQINCQRVDSLYIKGVLDRRKSGTGYVYWIKSNVANRESE